MITRPVVRWNDLTRVQQFALLSEFEAGKSFKAWVIHVVLPPAKPGDPPGGLCLTDLDIVTIVGQILTTTDPLIELVALPMKSMPNVLRGNLTDKGRRTLYTLRETT